MPADITIHDSLTNCRVCLWTHAIQGPTLVMLVMATKATCMAKAMLVEPERERSEQPEITEST